MSDACSMPTPLPDLLAYWAGEMDATVEETLEAHLIACGQCCARLARLVELAAAIRGQFRAGRLGAVLSAASIRHLQEAGMQVREYRLPAGGSVNCTVGPGDDLVAAHLQAPLRDVRRLDLTFDPGGEGARLRMADIPFDPTSGVVVLASSVEQLRTLGVVTLRAALIAVDERAEQVIGDYTFRHSPWS